MVFDTVNHSGVSKSLQEGIKRVSLHHGSQDTPSGAHLTLAQLLWLSEVQICLLPLSFPLLVWRVPLFTASAGFINSTKKYCLSHQDEAVNFPFKHLTMIEHNPGNNRSLSLTGVQHTWLCTCLECTYTSWLEVFWFIQLRTAQGVFGTTILPGTLKLVCYLQEKRVFQTRSG